MNLIIWILIGMFLFADFCVVHFIPQTATGSVPKNLLAFFTGLNAKALALFDSLVNEVEGHWPYWCAMVLLYVLLIGTDLILFVKILVGYFVLRMIQDSILKIFEKK